MGKNALAPFLAALIAVAAIQGPVAFAGDSGEVLNPQARMTRVDTLFKEGGEAGATGITIFLRDPDPDVRTHAMTRLVDLGKSAVPPLIAIVDQEDIRWLVSGALINIGSPAVPATIEALDNASPAVRRNSLFILRQLEASEALPAIRKALSDPDRTVQTQAIQAVAQFGGEEGLQAIRDKIESDSPTVRDAAVAALPRFGPSGITTLTSLMAYGSPDVRSAAMREIGMLGTPETRSLIRKGLTDPSPAVRFYATEALGDTNDPEVLPDIATRFDDPDATVREAASEAASRMVQAAQPILFRFLREGNANQKISATVTLRKARHRPAVRLLSEAMRDRTPEVKVSAVAALMAIADPASVEDLVNGLGDPEVRWICVMALRKFGETNLRPLLRRGSDPLMNHWKQYVLDGMGNRILEGCLDSLDTEENTDVRIATVCSMRQIKDTRAVYPLIAMLGDEKLGYLAASVLGQMGEIAVEPLIAVLKDENAAKRARAASALGEIGLSRVVKPLRDLLRDTDPEVRQAAQRAVQKMSGEDGPALQ
ncbi:MAG TPA: HEAT repeat domain-containing protein [Candidatus Deferrimicrobiaceae bacterium]|jgi:HEAT repeat protein